MANPIYRKRAKEFGSINYGKPGTWQTTYAKCPKCFAPEGIEIEIDVEEPGGVSKELVRCSQCDEGFYFSYEIDINFTLEHDWNRS